MADAINGALPRFAEGLLARNDCASEDACKRLYNISALDEAFQGEVLLPLEKSSSNKTLARA